MIQSVRVNQVTEVGDIKSFHDALSLRTQVTNVMPWDSIHQKAPLTLSV